MPKIVKLIGEKFGKLTVIERLTPKGIAHPKYLTICECGNKKEVTSSNLLNNSTKSCGCLAIKSRKERFKTHGKSNTRIYGIWKDVLYRCKTNIKGYEDVIVCERWKTFENFYNDNINNYKDNLTIDRIDPFGDYEPSNCRWITIQEQGLNKRKTLWFNKEEKIALKNKCKELNLNYHSVWQRINRLNWAIEEALSQPIRKCEHHGKNY